MKFIDPRVLSAIQYGYREGPLMPVISGDFEVGIDMRNKDWPGELFITSGPDPRVLIADEVLYQLAYRPEEVHPDVTLQRRRCDPDRRCIICHSGGECFYGSLLRFECRAGRDDYAHRTVIYQIVGHEARPSAWWARWPD